MRELFRVGRHSAPRLVVAKDCFGARRLRVVARVAGRDRVQDLRHFPLHDLARGGVVLLDHRALEKFVAALDEADAVEGVAARGVVHRVAAVGRAEAGGANRRGRDALRYSAVTVLARDLDDGASVAVDFVRAVVVLRVVAVNAVHPLFEMYVFQVNSLAGRAVVLEEIGVVIRDDVVVPVEIPALPVQLVNASEHPAVAVVVGDLHVAHLRVELADLEQRFWVAPESARGCLFGVEATGAV